MNQTFRGEGRLLGPACGLGLRRDHYDTVLGEQPPVPFFEVISENFMVDGGRPLDVLRRVRADYPVALHGVSLSIGSAAPLDEAYLDRLEELVRRVEPAIVSDHLCWTSLGGHNSHELLPLPFTGEAVDTVAEKILRVQERLGRRILVENVSTYLRLSGGEMTEWEFVSQVARRAGCGILLDVNNVYVNARNHGFDPEDYLEGVPAGSVEQYHLAGHQDHGDYILDTHDHDIVEEVWALFRKAMDRIGPRPTIIERDDHIPPFPALKAEMDRAQEILDAVPVA